jgi:hypothetical protein
MKVKTTLYLEREMKRAIERTARERDCSEAEVIRAAIAKEVADGDERPLPRFGLFSAEPFADRVDEILAEGFGED